MNIASDIPVAQPAAGGLLQDDAALQGLAELVGKLEPLLAGRRLNRVVDLLSATADLVDMADDYMVEKVAKAFEDGVGAHRGIMAEAGLLGVVAVGIGIVRR